MSCVRRFGWVALLLPLCGCFGVAHNPAYFPSWWPAGDIVRTHAKPGGRGNFANFDPNAVRLEVRPLRSSNPVRTQHLVIATVLDKEGDARRKRRVEWMLEGVGNIVEVDESGYFAGRGYKVDNKYAVSYTDYVEHTITRGNDDPNDDFVIRPGQSWCIITSPSEGETRLTAYAPEIYDWNERTQTVSMYWVDCQWQFPAPATVRAGSPHTLTTRLFRHSDKAPVANYRVRYTLLDGGPQAELLPNRGREAIVNSDSSGNASAAIQQLNLQPGINRIGVEVIRPADSGNPNTAPVVLASQETSIDWQAAQIQVNLNAPTAAAINQEIPATITVTNNGQVDTQTGQIYLQVPPGMSFVRSDPPARPDQRGFLIWDLNALGGGRQQTVNVTFRARDKGSFAARVVAATRDDMRAEQGATIRVEQGGLKIELVLESMAGPKTGVVGSPFDCEIRLTNPSEAEVSKVILDLWLEPDLVAVAPNGTRFERKLQNDRIPSLKPGETKILPIRFDAAKAGRFTVTAMASAEGGLSAETRATVVFQEAQVELKRNGPARVFVNREGMWDLRVRNAGNIPLTGAVLRERLPAELAFRGATDGGQFDPRTNEVMWNFGNLAAGEERIVKVTALAARPTTRAIMTTRLTGGPNVDKQNENTIQLLGVPALHVDVTSDANPIELGGRVAYLIRVTNQGTLPADQLDIAAELPPLMRSLGGRGPQPGTTRGNVVTFPAINNLLPNQTATFTVWGQAIEAGDARFRVTVQSPSLSQPVITEEATRILAPIKR